jgi:hypothetical protein
MNDEVEVKRKPGRPRKDPRPGILTAEQILALQTPQQIEAAEAREKERLRGIARRAEKKVLDSMSKAETIQEFWAESRKLVDAAKLAEWQARHEYVEALLGDIRTVLEGREPDAEFITDVDDEIRADIKEHGVTGVTVPLLIGPFWRDPELLAKLTSSDDSPSAVFAQFGFLLAVDDYTLHKWEAVIATHRKQPQPANMGVTYVSLKCSSCNALPMSVTSEIAEAYSRSRDYKCANCLEKATNIRSFTQERQLPENADILDGWGRVK